MNTGENTKYSLLNRLIVDSVITDGFQSTDLFYENSQSLNARIFTLFCVYIVFRTVWNRSATRAPRCFIGTNEKQQQMKSDY